MSLRARVTGIAGATAVAVLLLAGQAAAAPSATAGPPPATRSIVVGSNPYDVAVAQNLGRAFVVNDGSVSVISLLTRRQIAVFGTGGDHGQNAIALVRSNTQGYLTNNLTDSVTVVDTETHQVLRHIRVGYGAVDVVKANTEHGQRAYVLTTEPAALSHPGRNELIGIDTRSGRIVQRTVLPDFAYTLAVGRGARTIWVGSNDDGRIWQVSTATGTIVTTMKATKAGPVTGMAFTPGKKQLWVSGLGGVAVIDATTGRTRKLITAPKIFSGFPQLGSIAVNGSGRYAFVENSVPSGSGSPSQVAAIDTKSYKIIWRVPTGAQSEGFALDKTRGVAYLANYDDDTVTAIPVPR